MRPCYEDDYVTLYCGDAREIVPTLTGITAVVTDPPYGVNHDTDYTRFTGGASTRRQWHAPIVGDDAPFDPSPLLDVCSNVVLFGANCFSDRLPRGSWIIWDKRTPAGNKNVMSDGEVAWWSRGHGVYIYSHTWDGFNRASERNTAFHPTQKPVALFHWVIQRCVPREGEGSILDPFCGSASVLIAARNLGRRAIGIEIDERYVEIAVERLAQSVLPLEAV